MDPSPGFPTSRATERGDADARASISPEIARDYIDLSSQYYSNYFNPEETDM